MPSVALPPEIRAKLYLGFAVVGVALGAIQVGYGAASVDQPTWLTGALAVYVFAGPALGLTAASNTTIPTDPEFIDSIDEEEEIPGLAAASTYAVEPDRGPGDSDPVVIYDRSQRPTCNPEEEGC